MKNSIKTLAMWLIILVIFIVLITSILDSSNNKLAYSELVSKIETGEVKEIEISSDGSKAQVTLKNENMPKEVNIPSIDSLMDTLQDAMKNESVKVTEKDGWKWTFDDLPKYNSDKKEVVYTITEDEAWANIVMGSVG